MREAEDECVTDVAAVHEAEDEGVERRRHHARGRDLLGSSLTPPFTLVSSTLIDAPSALFGPSFSRVYYTHLSNTRHGCCPRARG